MKNEVKACATAGGGVMFLPDSIERRTNKPQQAPPVSYHDLVAKTDMAPTRPQTLFRKLFGRRIPAESADDQKVA